MENQSEKCDNCGAKIKTRNFGLINKKKKKGVKMDQKTFEALNEMRKAVAKSKGIDESQITMSVCRAREIPFDENNNCISCDHHEDEPDWYCPNCGEFIPDLPDNVSE